MNKAILMGRMTANPDMKVTPNGVSVCTFTLAVNRRFKNSEGNYDADFINCVAWRGTAEFIANNFEKGRMIGVIGSIQTRTYEKDGQKRYITEVVADEAYFAGDSKRAGVSENTSDNTESGFIPMPANDDSLPF